MNVGSQLYEGTPLFWAWMHVAEATCLLGTRDAAAQPVVQALKLWPDPPGDEPTMEYLVDRVGGLGLVPAVLALLGAAAGETPKTAVACHFAAVANAKSNGKFEQGLQLLEAGHTLAPERPTLALELANHLVAGGERQRAAALAREVLPRCHFAPGARLAAADVLRSCGASVDETLPLLRATPGDQKTRRYSERADQLEAEILLGADRELEALAPAVRAARLSGRTGPCMTVGRVYSKLGDYAEALRWVSKGLVNEPEHAGLQAARATLLALLGRSDEALQAAQLLG